MGLLEIRSTLHAARRSIERPLPLAQLATIAKLMVDMVVVHIPVLPYGISSNDANSPRTSTKGVRT